MEDYIIKVEVTVTQKVDPYSHKTILKETTECIKPGTFPALRVGLKSRLVRVREDLMERVYDLEAKASEEKEASE